MDNPNHLFRHQKSHERYHPYQRGGENKRGRGRGRWNNPRGGRGGMNLNQAQFGHGLQQALDERNQLLLSEGRTGQSSPHDGTRHKGFNDARNNQKGGIYVCDACDRSFPTEQAQQQHFAEHVTCNLDGCTFTSHPKILLKHIEMQHSNNLFSRLKKLNDPDDINKWKEDRKKNYPTAITVERKVKEREERVARGERYPGSDRRGRGGRGRPGGQHGSRDQRHRNNAPEAKVRSSDPSKSVSTENLPTGSSDPLDHKDNPAKRERKVFTYGEEKQANFVKNETVETIVLDNFYSKVKVNAENKLMGTGLMNWNSSTLKMVDKIASTGLSMRYLMSDDAPMSDSEEEQNVVQDDVNITDDEEWQTSDTEEAKRQVEEKSTAPGIGAGTAKVLGPALGLVAYSDDSDSEGEAPLEVPTVKPSVTESSNTIDAPKNESRPAELIAEPGRVDEMAAEIVAPSQTSEEQESRPSRKSKSTTVSKSSKPKRRQRMPQLLQKLLANDIRKERNQILQVCRFILENNFFDAPVPVVPNAVDLPQSSESRPEVDKAIGPEATVKSDLPDSEVECTKRTSAPANSTTHSESGGA